MPASPPHTSLVVLAGAAVCHLTVSLGSTAFFVAKFGSFSMPAALAWASGVAFFAACYIMLIGVPVALLLHRFTARKPVWFAVVVFAVGGGLTGLLPVLGNMAFISVVAAPLGAVGAAVGRAAAEGVASRPKALGFVLAVSALTLVLTSLSLLPS